MTWSNCGTIQLSADWQYTEPIVAGSYFRLKHREAPNGGLYAIAQCEVDAEGNLSISDSQILAVEKSVADVLKLSKGAFTDRRLAIKRIRSQPNLEQEIRRLFLPNFLMPIDQEINYIRRNNWQVDIEVSDFVEATTSAGGGTNTPPATSSNTKNLTYTSDGDANGACYWLGTNYGTEAWTNPHTAGRVICSKSSDAEAGLNLNFLERLVDRATNSVSTANATNSWIKIDFGSTNKLIVNYYSLQGRSDQFNDNHLQNWKLQGSNDNTNWIDVDNQVNNSLTPTTWKSIAVPGQTTGYRYLRILQTGVTSSNANYLAFGEFEFYGTLIQT